MPVILIIISFLVLPLILTGISNSITVYWNGHTLSSSPPGKAFHLPQQEKQLFKEVDPSGLREPGGLASYTYYATYCSYQSFEEHPDPQVVKQVENKVNELSLKELPGHLHPVFHGIHGREIIEFYETCKQHQEISWWDVETRMEFDWETDQFVIQTKKESLDSAPKIKELFQPRKYESEFGTVMILRFRVGNSTDADGRIPILFWFVANNLYWLGEIKITLQE